MSELSPEAASIVDAARDGDNPTAADKRRVRAAIMAQVAVTAGATQSAQAATHAPAATTAGAGAGGAIKALVVALVAGGIAVGGYVAMSGGDTEPRAALVAPDPDEVDYDMPPDELPAVEAPAEPAGVEPAGVEPAPSPTPRRVERTTARSSAGPASTPSLSQLRAEKRLIDRARQALSAGQPGRALAILGEHRQRYRRSQLAAERDGTEVLAHCASGEIERARRAANSFLRRYPDHPMAARVRASCAAP